MEETGYVIKNKYFTTVNAYYADQGNFVSLVNAKIFSGEVDCQMMINKICHTYKDVESYSVENLEMKKVVIKIVE